jgi:ketosteroid isomerase-like protein
MNNVYRVNLSSGLVGQLITSPKRGLEQCISQASAQGEEVMFVLRDRMNVLQLLINLVILILTLFMWCPAPGYLIVTRPMRKPTGRRVSSGAREPAAKIMGGEAAAEYSAGPVVARPPAGDSLPSMEQSKLGVAQPAPMPEQPSPSLGSLFLKVRWSAYASPSVAVLSVVGVGLAVVAVVLEFLVRSSSVAWQAGLAGAALSVVGVGIALACRVAQRCSVAALLLCLAAMAAVQMAPELRRGSGGPRSRELSPRSRSAPVMVAPSAAREAPPAPAAAEANDGATAQEGTGATSDGYPEEEAGSKGAQAGGTEAEPGAEAPHGEKAPEPSKAVVASEASGAPALEPALAVPTVVEIPQSTLAAQCSSSDKPIKLPGDQKITYDASAILDGNLATAWAEGKKGDGVGEWIELRLTAAEPLDHLTVWNGYQKVLQDRLGDRFVINQRVREFQVQAGDAEPFTVTLEDKRAAQEVSLGGVRADRVRLTIRSVYGARFADTTLSEVRVFVRSAPISEEQVSRLVETWVQAQNAGTFDTYAAFYAGSFEGVKRAGERRTTYDRRLWLEDRMKMFEHPMKVSAENLRFEAKDGRLAVTFLQRFSSGKYADRGDKELQVVRQGGELKIAREEMLFSEIAR